MTPAPPQTNPIDADPALWSLHDIATAADPGSSLDDVANAVVERFARAAGVARVVLVVTADGERPARIAAVWPRDMAPPPPGPSHGLPDEPASLAAALSLPDAMVTPLQAAGRTVGTVILEGVSDEDSVRRLTVPAGSALGAALRLDAESTRAERAERLSSLTRDLMSIVSHELRTPLTSVIGSLQTLQRPEVDASGPEGRRLIASALSRAERLRTLLEDLAVTTRSDGPVRVRHRPVDPGEVVRAAIASVPGAESLAAADVDPTVGPVLADRSHLERVLVNLLDNAVRHGRGPVEVTVRRSGDRLVISVVDHGPGLPPTIARAVLDRRHDSPDAALRPSGPGLGLTVTRGLTEGLGGTLRHDVTPGGGATFVVEIPYRDGR